MEPQSSSHTMSAMPFSSPVERQPPPSSLALPLPSSPMEPQSPPLLAPLPVSSPDPAASLNLDHDAITTALHLKSLAESKLHASSLKSALKYARRARATLPCLPSLNHFVTALKILRADPSDHYRILRLDPFSPISAIKKQYKTLALILHPDKSVSTIPGAEDAFKRVADSFLFLSDRILKRSYDNSLHIALSAPVALDVADDGATTFWTDNMALPRLTAARSRNNTRPRVLTASWVTATRSRINTRPRNLTEWTVSTRKREPTTLTAPRVTVARSRINTRPRDLTEWTVFTQKRKPITPAVLADPSTPKCEKAVAEIQLEVTTLTTPRVTAARSRIKTRPRDLTEWTISTQKRKSMTPTISIDSSTPKRAKPVTEIQLEPMVQRGKNSNLNVRAKGVKGGCQLSMQSLTRRAHSPGNKLSLNKGGKLSAWSSAGRVYYVGGKLSLNEGGRLRLNEEDELNTGSSTRRAQPVRGELTVMAVEDFDFHDFDKDRMEKCFVVGQVWGIYDNDDGMPRHYGLINAVLGKNPFRVKMSWLDAESNGEGDLLARENAKDYISCGRFKVGRKIEYDSVNFFSHLVDYERAASDIYRIYPKKGSVWALYYERSLGDKEERSYDIMVCLASYKDMYGMSMAYLEKVKGFKTLFKRREVGAHAIRWLKKGDMSLLSHQVPARKMVDVEGVELPKDCWELDPASLPPSLLQIGWGWE